jgi:hypothetical protein
MHNKIFTQIAVILSLVLFSVHAAVAETPKEAGLTSFISICLVASEQSKAPRDLAKAAGLLESKERDKGIEALFPIAALGINFDVPSNTGKVRLLSTVMPPPATPYSCMITVDGNVDGIETDIESRLGAVGYTKRNNRSTEQVIVFQYQKLNPKLANQPVDNVIVIRNLKPNNNGDLILVAYRVG